MEEGYGEKGSSSSAASRLSPLAQPFTMNRAAGQPPASNPLTNSIHKPFTPSPSNQLDRSDTLSLTQFSNLSLDDQLRNPYPALQSESSLSSFSFDDPLEFAADSSFPQYPLVPFEAYCDSSTVADENGFDGFLSNKSSVTSNTLCSTYGGRGRTTTNDQRFKSSNRVGPSARESLLKQDSKLTSYKVSTASDVLPSSMLKNIPQEFSAPVFGSSAANTISSPSSHILSKTLDFMGNGVVSNNASSPGRNLPQKREHHVVLNTYNKEVHDDESLVDIGMEIKDVKSVSCKGLDPLEMEKQKSKLQVISKDIPDDLILELSKPIAGVSIESSSKKLDDNESDLDSPCWKGIQNSNKSSLTVLESFNSHPLGNESEAGTSLNPQAPQFFPSHAKGCKDYFQNNFGGDCFSSFGEGECSGFNSLYKEQPLLNSSKAGTKPPGLNASSYRHSNKIYDSGKESAIAKNLKTSSVLQLPQMVKPSPVDKFFKSKQMPVTQVNVAGFEDGAKDDLHNSPTNLSAFAREHTSNLSSPGVGAPNDCSEILKCLSQSQSKCSKINVAVMVNAIRYLSELLVQNCSNGLDSLNEHEHETIWHAINNLNVLIKHRVGKETQMLDFPHTGSSVDYRDKSTAIHEQSNMEFQVTRRNGPVVQRELDKWSDHEWQKGYSRVSTRKMQDLFSSSRDVGSERGNSIITGNQTMQVLRKALIENRQIDEEMHPQALLNLLLEAEGALLSMKYENCILRMKLAMVGCKPEER